MKTQKQTILLLTLFSSFTAFSAAWGQAPSPQQPPAKAGAAQPQVPRIIRFSTADASDLILESTGKSPVDKAAVQAGEERDAESRQAISDGETLLKAGKIQDAIASYKNALAISPVDGLAYERLAEAYTASGQLNEASQAFHKVLIEGFGPGNGNGVRGNVNIWAEYALVLVKTKQDAEAAQAYNHAAYLSDYEISQYGGVKPHLKVMLPEIAAVPTSPDQVQYTPEHLQALADTILAHEESAFGSNKEAYAHTQEAVKLYPNSAVAQYYLGKALEGPLQSAEAKAAYQKAAELGDDATVAAAKEQIAMLR